MLDYLAVCIETENIDVRPLRDLVSWPLLLEMKNDLIIFRHHPLGMYTLAKLLLRRALKLIDDSLCRLQLGDCVGDKWLPQTIPHFSRLGLKGH